MAELNEGDIRNNPYGNSDKVRESQAVTREEHESRVTTRTNVVVGEKKESKFDWLIGKLKSIGDYLVHDILVPAAIDTAADMAYNSIDMFAYGESRGSRRKKDRDRRNYGDYYRRKDDRDRERSRSRDRYSDEEPWEGIVIEPPVGGNMQDAQEIAEDIIKDMVDLCVDYGQVRVSDLFDLVGKSTDWRKGYDYIGWYKEDIRFFNTRRVRNGYLLEFPRASKLSH